MSTLIQSVYVVLRKRQLCQRIGLSPAQVYAMLDSKSPSHDPSFPRQIRLGAAAVGWLEHEIQAWLEARIEISRSESKSSIFARSSAAGATCKVGQIQTNAKIKVGAPA